MKIFILTLFFGLAFTTAHAVEQRVALVVGNGAYEIVPDLPNPTRDASAIATKLQELGFTVIEGYDLDVYSLQQKVREFSKAARTADMTLFYYAGHGMGVEGKNYIVPIDARFEDAAALEFETVELDTIMRQMHASNGVSLVFLDACRDNPDMSNAVARSLSQGTRSVSVGKGLVAVEVSDNGKGTAIAFATSPGDVAYDGIGQHSPFTQALLTHLDKPNTSISEIMAHVTGDVRNATNDRQKPWLRASLTGPVYLKRHDTPVVDVAVALSDSNNSLESGNDDQPSAIANLQAQQALYDIAVKSDKIDDYNSYLSVFPNGLFVLNAQKAIDRLKQNEVYEPVIAQTSRSTDIVEPSGPLVLKVTDALRAMPSNPSTENELGMDRTKRREIQARLNLVGQNVGAADGAFGPKTRQGIAQWQVQQGLQPTQYLNSPQLQLLQSQTEAGWLAWSASNPAPVASRASSSSGGGGSSQNSNNNGKNLGNAAKLIGTAIILKKLLD